MPGYSHSVTTSTPGMRRGNYLFYRLHSFTKMTQCQSKITVSARIIAPYAWWLPNGHRVGPTVTPRRRVSESALNDSIIFQSGFLAFHFCTLSSIFMHSCHIGLWRYIIAFLIQVKKTTNYALLLCLYYLNNLRFAIKHELSRTS